MDVNKRKRKFSRKVSKNISSLNYLLWLFVITFFSACSPGVSGLGELRKACKEDAGWKIEKSVEAVGYYDMTTQCHYCWHDLISSPFQFVEFCDDDVNRKFKSSVLPDLGCYRLSKTKRPSENCHKEIDSDLMKKAVEPYISFREKECISVVKLNHVTSKYAYSTSTEETWLDKKKGVLLIKGFMRVNEISTGNLLSEYVSYSLVPGGAKTPQSKPILSCDSIIENRDNKNRFWPAYQIFVRKAFGKEI